MPVFYIYYWAGGWVVVLSLPRGTLSPVSIYFKYVCIYTIYFFINYLLIFRDTSCLWQPSTRQPCPRDAGQYLFFKLYTAVYTCLIFLHYRASPAYIFFKYACPPHYSVPLCLALHIHRGTRLYYYIFF